MKTKQKSLFLIQLLLLAILSIAAQTPSGYTWQDVKSVNFGNGANHFSIKAASKGLGGEVQLRLDSADGPVLGYAFFHHTGDSNHFMDYECELNQTIAGTHNVYMNFLDYLDPGEEHVLNIGDFQFDLIESLPVSNMNRLQIYPDVPGLDPSPYYNIEIQKVSALNNINNLADSSNNWLSTFAWFTESVDEVGYYNDNKFYSQTYTNFELDANTPVVVKITRKSSAEITNGAPSGPITSAAVVPIKNYDSVQIFNGAVYVTMSKPAQVVIDIDERLSGRTPNIPGGVRLYNNFEEAPHSVTLFANPVIEDKPDINDTNNVYVIEAGKKIPDNLEQISQSIIYFEPGVHKASVDENLNERRWEFDDIIPLADNKSYYIPGNAIVYGNFAGQNGENIRVYGHGVISGKKIVHWHYYRDNDLDDAGWNHRGIMFGSFSKNCHIEGVTMQDGANHTLQFGAIGPDQSTVKWLKVIGWRINTDGVSVSGNIKVEDCFIRCQDDGLYTGGAKPMRRCIFWHDVHGFPFKGNNMSSTIRSDYPDYLPKQLIVEDIDLVFARAVFGGNSNIGGPTIGVTASGAKDNETLPDGTENTAQMVYFKNIKISDPVPIKSLFVFESGDKIGDYAGIRLENIEYNKYYYQWKDAFIGTPDAKLRNFVFDNVKISGQQMDDNYLNNPDLCLKSNVYDFTFRLRDVIASTGKTLIRTATNGVISMTNSQGSNQVKVTATPSNSNYKFVGWSGSISGTEPEMTFTMDEDKAITANFKNDMGCDDLPWLRSDFVTNNEVRTDYSLGKVNISCATNIKIEFDLLGEGGLDPADYIEVYYKLDDGPKQQISKYFDDLDLTSESTTLSGGSSIELFVSAETTFDDEKYNIKNIKIIEEGALNQKEILDFENKAIVSVYPIPCEDMISVESDINDGELQLYSVLGKLLISKQIVRKKQIVDVSELESGMYVIKIIGRSETTSIRIIKN